MKASIRKAIEEGTVRLVSDNSEAYDVGDVVKLLSGGPSMTVTAIYPDRDVAVCWFGNNEIYSLRLPAASITRAEEANVASISQPPPV